jgi:hypothetical protein
MKVPLLICYCIGTLTLLGTLLGEQVSDDTATKRHIRLWTDIQAKLSGVLANNGKRE